MQDAGAGSTPIRRSRRATSLQARLLLLVAGSLLPLLALTFVQQYRDFQEDIRSTKRETLVLAHSMARLVSRELDGYVRNMTVLATTPALQSDPPDMTELRRRAEAVQASFPGANILLLRRDGTEVMNLDLPPGTPPHKRRDMRTTEQVFATGLPAVSGIRRSQTDNRWVIAVDVPVKAPDGSVRYVISVNPRLEAFEHILTDGLPSTWIAGVYDSTLHLVARFPDGNRFIGQPLPESLRAHLARNDSGATEDNISREGIPTVSVFTRTPPYDWAVAIGIPRAALEARAEAEALTTVVAAAVLLLVSVAIALYTANRISRPIASLRRFAAVRDAPNAPPATGLREVDEVSDALWTAQSERRKSEEEQQQALTRLAESENTAQQILDGALDGFVQFDQDLTITAWNNQAEAIFGWSREEMLGARLEERVFRPDERERVRQEVARYISTGQSHFIGVRREMDAVRRDGSLVRIEQAVTVIHRRDKHVLFNGFVRDLTQKLMIENQLRQAQKMEAIGNLTGGMAHDFNNLLTVIIGSLDGAEELAPGNTELREVVQGALDAALHGADLTRGLLAFARQQPLQPREIDVNALLRETTLLLRRLIGESIEVSLNLGTGIWPVIADPAQLEASLANLATNARDAMPNGGRLIIGTRNQHLDADYASVRQEVVPGDYALIEVSDTGTGIPPDAMSRIFDPFFTTKEPGKGTGLGLSMVFGFIKQSAGHIAVYSEVGAGTTFRLYLPRATGEDGPQEADGLAETVAADTGETILVVEDNPAVRRVVLRQLRQLGYRVLECDRPAAALEMLSEQPVDLMFTDIVMPGGMDGFALARMAHERLPSLKIVLTSGFPQAHVDGDALGRFRLLSKPYGRVELAAALREVLEDR
ncbi:MAG TPA: ATP-binding protein [Rhodopila sp.]|uniref:ATP-binding protein n=1 Tax=Rhodopila sp. TaxID=2480087 RepID=UPI002CF86462|nr:ATP-binding protein [Rhodopila sp.]HVY15693.1 ATP-binding protein [Rhodopila sp.]